MNVSKLNYQVFAFPIVLFLVLFLVWASIMEIGEFVRAFGKVVPSGQVKRIQHLEGGIISEILVKEGQIVRKGDTIYRVRNEAAISNLGELQVDLYSKMSVEARLKAEISGMDNIQFPVEVTQKYPKIIDNELKLFSQRKNNFKNTLDVVLQQLEQKRLSLKESRAREKNLSLQMQFQQQQVEMLTQLVKSGAGSEKELIDSKIRSQDTLTQLEDVQNRMNTIEKEVAEVEARVEETKTRYSVDLQTELSVTLIEIEKLKEQINASLDRVTRTDVLSPVDGLIKSLAVSTIGGVIGSGDVIAEIIPTNDTLVIESRVRPEDRGRLFPGMPANLKITAYDSSIHGGIIGTIKDISADTFIDEGTRSPYYLVRIEANTQNGFGGNKPIYPGMIAEVNIVAGKRTVLVYLLKPILKVIDNALIEP
jgi:HlyD family type I secretion membrane fusion protein